MNFADAFSQYSDTPKASDMQVAPEIQKSRDSDRLRILKQEKADQQKSGVSDPALDAELARAGGESLVKEAKPGRFSAAFESAPVAVTPDKPVQKTGKAPPTFDTKPLTETALSVASGLGSSVIGGWRGLAHLATGGSMKSASDIVHEEAANRTYQPDEGSIAAGNVEALGSEYNPMNWPGLLGKYLGGKVVDVTGSPAAGSAVETLANVAPLPLVGKLGTGARRAAVTIEQPALRATIPVSENLDIPTIFRRRVAEPATPPATPQPAQAPRFEMADTSAPQSVSGPQIPARQPAVAPVVERVDTSAPVPVVGPEVPKFEPEAALAPEGQKLTVQEQSTRAAILNRLGIDSARKSALEGDAKAAATDFQASKLDNPQGDYLRGVIDKERESLTRHAENIVSETGGTAGLDETARMGRGNTIIAPLDGFKKWFDTNISRLYKEADAQAGGQPIEMPELHKLMGGDKADFLGTVEGQQLLHGVTARMKSLGMLDAEGKATPATIQQAERLKQYLGDQWSPRTARLIQRMKDHIDEDVMAGAGEDIYKEARAIRRMRAVTLDDPNGIAKIMDASGPEGINRAVAVEKIPDVIATMPVNQFDHIIQTLKNVPAELQPQAQAALSEIKAQMANRLLEAGSKRAGGWAARDVTKYLNANAEKLSRIFTKDELAKIQDLNDAGHILATDRSYPGAAVQQHNLVQRGAMGAIKAGSAAAGGFLGGPIGAAAGAYAGEGLANKISQGASLKAAQKRVITIKELLHGK